MEDLTYQIEADFVDRHWWFRGRRELFRRLLLGSKAGPRDRVIDIGTSSGTNLLLLKQLGFENVNGVDLSDEAIRLCAARGLAPVLKGDACALPIKDATVDFVFATDVLEHLERDDVGAREIARVLKPGARALVTVPAFQSLWGLQDDVSHHKRRYRLHEVKRLLAQAGLQVERAFYFNFILFVPVFAARLLYRLGFMKGVKNEAQVGGPLLNWIFLQIFRLDIFLAPLLPVPFGVSACVVARKPEN